MDNIKVLIATIDFLVHNLQSYSFDGTLHREALVGALRDCKAALAPLAEPGEIPEEPEPHDDDAIYIDRLCMYASELRSALERALAASESAFNRGLKAGNEQSVMQQTALIAATARAEDTQRMLEAEHDAHMECHRRAEASERNAARYRWIPVTERQPTEKKSYQVIKRHHDGKVVMTERYWVGHAWDSRAQITHWRETDFPTALDAAARSG